MEDSLDKIIRLTFDLSRIMRHVMGCLAEEGTRVNFLQIHALALIGEHPGMTMKELAEFLHVASPSATSFVGRMEKLGWVARSHDSDNRKLVHLQLTSKGNAVLREKKTKRTAVIRDILRLLSAEEQQQLARILEKLHRASAELDHR